MRTLLWTILILCGVVSSAAAWDDGGHMLVAQIAQNELRPAVRQRVDDLVKLVPDFRQIKSAEPYDSVTVACWMDDLRDSNQRNAYSTWHYINVPCGGDPHEVTTQNALNAIELAKIVLRAPSAGDKVKAEWLAVLMHLVGDVHQPLHCSDRDLGGNTYPIADVPGLDKRIRRDGNSVDRNQPVTGDNAGVFQRLHAYWDSAYRYDSNEKADAIKLLFNPGSSSQANRQKIRSVAETIEKSSAEQKASLDPAEWIRESSAISCEFVFTTPRMQRPSGAYVHRAHEIANERIGLAGRRLAALLNDIFVASE